MMQDNPTSDRSGSSGIGLAILSGAVLPLLTAFFTTFFSVDPLIKRLELVKEAARASSIKAANQT